MYPTELTSATGFNPGGRSWRPNASQFEYTHTGGLLTIQMRDQACEAPTQPVRHLQPFMYDTDDAELAS